MEKIDQPLELSAEGIKLIYHQTNDFIHKFETQRDCSSPKGSALDPQTNYIAKDFKWVYQATKNFPEQPEDYKKLLHFIETDVAYTAQQPGHKGYMAYVAGAANPVSAPAQAIALTLNQFTGHYSLAPGLVSLEVEVIRWFSNMIQYPQSASGVLTSGGSQANMMALVAARNKYYNSSDLSKACFYASEQVHHCIGKALAFLGFPKSALRIIAVNEKFRMNTQQLEQQIIKDKKDGFIPVAVVGTAGSTNTGSVDDLTEISKISKNHNLWFHVDGAYGAFFMLTEKGKTALSGIELSDSVALDPHKALQIPYGVGCLLMRNIQDLTTQYAGESSYMPPSSGLVDESSARVDFADITPELSRDPRGLRLWLPLKTFGIGPFKLNLEEKLKLIDYFSEEVKKIKGVNLLTTADLSIACISLENDELTKKLLTWINSQNKLFLSGCEIKGKFYIRVCLLGFRLHFAEVNLLLQQMQEGLKYVAG